MQNSIFSDSKNVFLDRVDPKEYIQLDRLSAIYSSLKESIQKPLKMILLYGKPGTGKSMFLQKVATDLQESQSIFLYATPILDESAFYRTLAQDIFGIKYKGPLNFTQFLQISDEKNLQNTPVVLLDEAQLYSDELMEKIRLLADTRKIKFVIVLHKTDDEDLIAKEHFKTRIWESIKLENSTKEELKIYIQKKLMKANCFDTANMFTHKTVHRIYQLTEGNYRETNKLLYTLFAIYEQYANNGQAHTFKKSEISIKFLEMAALHVGLLND